MEQIFVVLLFVGLSVIKAVVNKKVKNGSKDDTQGRTLGDEIPDIFEMFQEANETKTEIEKEEKVEVPQQAYTPRQTENETSYSKTEKQKEVEKETNAFIYEPDFSTNFTDSKAKIKAKKKETAKPLLKETQKGKGQIFKKIEKFNYLEKGLIYKEIFDKPISMREF